MINWYQNILSFNSVSNHTSNKQNQTNAKRESDLLITSIGLQSYITMIYSQRANLFIRFKD